jgi:hypothetical protein
LLVGRTILSVDLARTDRIVRPTRPRVLNHGSKLYLYLIESKLGVLSVLGVKCFDFENEFRRQLGRRHLQRHGSHVPAPLY